LRRAPHSSPDLAPERKRTMPTNPAKFFQRPFRTVSQRPIRDRVIHLLALKNYRTAELLSCLEREGVVEKDKESLGKILQEVANLDANEGSFSLKEHFFKDIQEDWPGYSERDRQTLEVTLSQKAAPSQNATSTSQSPSLGPSERDTPPRTAQVFFACSAAERWNQAKGQGFPWKGPSAGEIVEPVPAILPSCSSAVHNFTSSSPVQIRGFSNSPSMMSKKRRIGHQPSHVQPPAGGLSSFLLPSTSLIPLGMPPSASSISPCTHVVQPTEKLQSSSIPVPAREQEEIPNSNGKKDELGRLKQLHCLDFNEGTRKDTSIASTCSATSNQPDYVRKYVAIVSLEQRQRYKDDFNAEYEEYRNLHSQIDKTVKKFRQFQEQWKSLTAGSEAYQMLLHRILADYQQLQQ
ncbi:unnamed protein product, partial [Coccothraustes coccothraustes]